MPSSSAFGKWNDERKALESGESTSNSMSSWLPVNIPTDTLPLFEGAEMPTFSGMRASLEAQLPQQIMGMNYQQRFQMFCGLLFMSALFFALGFFVGIPTIAIRPQKFALCFTLGSLAFMASFGILKGPVAHLQSMLTAERLPFTTIYIGSMLMTLYLTFNFGGINGYLLVMASCGVQMLSLLWYLISFLPGGSAGLQIVLSAIMRILSPIFVLCAKAHAVCMGYCLRYLMGGGSSSSSSGNS